MATPNPVPTCSEGSRPGTAARTRISRGAVSSITARRFSCCLGSTSPCTDGTRTRPLGATGVGVPAQHRVYENERSGDAHSGTHGLILLEQTELLEQVGPVVLAAPHERQLLRTGVLHVDGDVPAVLRDPPGAHGRRVAVALPPEVQHERGGKEQLQQGAA